MDNAVDALKIAFAVLVFVMAITVSITAFDQAKATSDEVFYMADKTNFYEYPSEEEQKQNQKLKLEEGRIVSIETIIPTLYRYYKENFNVTINNVEGKPICTFNLEKEIQEYSKNYKNAPWLGNANVDTKLRVDVEITGKKVEINGTMDYKNCPQIPDGLLAYAKGKKFRETFKEYRYSGKEVTVDDDGNIVYLYKEDEKGNLTYVDSNGKVNSQEKLNGDKETLELVKGNTKIEIIYTELPSSNQNNNSENNTDNN